MSRGGQEWCQTHQKLVNIRAGTLDRSDELNVAAHIWTKRKMGGIVIPDDVPNWPEAAPPQDFIAALSR